MLGDVELVGPSTGVCSRGGGGIPRDYLGVLGEEQESRREYVRTLHLEMPWDARGQSQSSGGAGGGCCLSPKGV